MESDSDGSSSRPLCLLSLDGGGIRGLSSLCFLEELMHRLKSAQNLPKEPIPADCFDMICGTSTGGLIALLLGRLKLSVNEAIRVYASLAEDIFGQKKWLWQDGKYKAQRLETAIKHVIMERLGPDHAEERMFATDQQCKTFVCAVPGRHVGTKPRLFRTWETKKNPGYNCRIWEAARATSAAPTLFKRISIGQDGMKEEFIDAGLGCNNPTVQLIEEALREFGPDKSVGCIVSIGTGRPNVSGFQRPRGFQRLIPTDLIKVLQDIATDSERVASTLRQRFQNCEGLYHRLNVERGLENISLAEWEELGAVRTHTIEYLQSSDAGKSLDAIVESLVNNSSTTFPLGHLDGKVADITPAAEESYFNYPANGVTYFVARKKIQSAIQKHLKLPNETSQPKGVVLIGMGGCGKSQLALEYCRSSKTNKVYKAIFWIDATSPATVEQSFVAIANELSLLDPKVPDSAEKFQFVLATLEKWKDPWLLVFDNYDDVQSFGSSGIKRYFPRGDKAAILITSRDEATRSLGRSIDISTMSPEEALELLYRRSETPRKDENLLEAENIVKRLGLHALAIDQAAAYIQSRSLSLDLFLEHYNRRREKILKEIPAVWDYRRRTRSDMEMETNLSVFTTFELSYALITGDPESQSEGGHSLPLSDKEYLLTLSAFFDGREMADDMIKLYGTEEQGFLKSCRTNGIWDDYKCQDILKEFRGLSLIQDLKIAAHGATYSLHPLIQDWLQLRMPLMVQRIYTVQAGSILSVFTKFQDFEVLPFDLLQNIMFHYEAVDRNMTAYLDPEDQLECKEAMNFNADFVYILLLLDRRQAAEELSRRWVEGLTNVVAEDDPQLFACRTRLAEVLLFMGKYVEALPLCRETMEMTKKVFGEKSEQTRHIARTTAHVLSRLGLSQEAEFIFKESFTQTETMERLTDMDTWITLLYEQGKYQEVLDTTDELLPEAEKIWTKEHLKVQYWMEIKAMALHQLEKYTQSERCFQDVLVYRRKALGKEHRTIIGDLFLLGIIQFEMGRYDEAESNLREAVVLSRKCLEDQDPLMKNCLHDLACVLLQQEKYEMAEPVYRELLVEKEKVLGKEDPETLHSMHDLGSTLARLGRIDEAVRLCGKTLSLREQILGNEHPDTICTRKNFEIILDMQRHLNR